MIDFIIGGLVLIAVILAVRKVIKNQKSAGCGCGCSGCSSEDACNAYKTFEAEAGEKMKNKDNN
ncbi:MAG: FeoB-associated Cys-rich membrane protein [Eubacteriales bacterium]|nr:FeoB-associated Cys-rich membrane protein [Eubacteriales bacterium]